MPQSAVREQHGHVIHAQDTGNQQADRYGQAQYLPQPVVSQDPPAGIGAGGLTIGEAHQQQVGGQYGQYAAYPQPQPDAAYPMQPITAPAAATAQPAYGAASAAVDDAGADARAVAQYGVEAPDVVDGAVQAKAQAAPDAAGQWVKDADADAAVLTGDAAAEATLHAPAAPAALPLGASTGDAAVEEATQQAEASASAAAAAAAVAAGDGMQARRESGKLTLPPL